MIEPPSDAGAAHDSRTLVSPAVAVSPVGALTVRPLVLGDVSGVTYGVVVPDVGVVVLGDVGVVVLGDVGVVVLGDVGVPDTEVGGGGSTIRGSVVGASADKGPWPAAFTAITLK